MDRVLLTFSDFGRQPRIEVAAGINYHSYNHSRAQPPGLGNELIDRQTRTPSGGRIRRWQRLGGLLNYYDRAA